ncbi:maleylpyruvate isomerase N-terminal domain-containing protein [Cryptosporangium minutisporangium]|uniref:Mycothiol-dependent maleylpyruvate isomerase metal-binding domain-containing protein n=1 Tax=Cryptosporangium minutisporangium TaxID=113569 RepID=A0ABP6SQ92_9ACTN
MPYPLPPAKDAFDATLARLDTLLGEITDQQLLAPSRCHGWAVCDVLAHLHLGLQEAITAFAYRVDTPADTDFAQYWRGGPADPPTADRDAEIAQIRFARLLASAYGRPSGLLRHLRPTVDALRRFVAAADDGQLAFQQRVLPVGDFVVTWAVEVAIHHLDVLVELPELPEPAPDGLALVAATLDRLRGTSDRPGGWDETTYALKGAGRLPLSDAERAELGATAERFPILG